MAKFYDENNNEKIFNLNKHTLIGSGYFGMVFKQDDEAIKIYGKNIETTGKVRFSTHDEKYTLDVLRIIRDLDLSAYCKIKDIFFDENGNLVGYSMGFIENAYKNVLDLKVSYLAEFYNRFESDLSKMKDFYIAIRDLNIGNAIFAKDCLYLIDVDSYEKCSDLHKEAVTDANRIYVRNFLIAHIFRKLNLDDSVISCYSDSFLECAKESVNNFMESDLSECDTYKDYMIKNNYIKLIR